MHGHELYNRVHIVVAQWEERNLVWLEETHSIGRLPKVPCPLEGDKGATSSASGMSTQSQDKSLETLDQEKKRLLRHVKSISTLKSVEASMIAQKLGYKEPVIKVHEAKNYIKQLKL